MSTAAGVVILTGIFGILLHMQYNRIYEKIFSKGYSESSDDHEGSERLRKIEKKINKSSERLDKIEKKIEEVENSDALKGFPFRRQ